MSFICCLNWNAGAIYLHCGLIVGVIYVVYLLAQLECRSDLSVMWFNCRSDLRHLFAVSLHWSEGAAYLLCHCDLIVGAIYVIYLLSVSIGVKERPIFCVIAI